MGLRFKEHRAKLETRLRQIADMDSEDEVLHEWVKDQEMEDRLVRDLDCDAETGEPKPKPSVSKPIQEPKRQLLLFKCDQLDWKIEFDRSYIKSHTFVKKMAFGDNWVIQRASPLLREKRLTEILDSELTSYLHHIDKFPLPGRRHYYILNMFYSIMVQAVIADPITWLAAVLARGDGNYRLLAVPAPVRYFLKDKKVFTRALDAVPTMIRGEPRYRKQVKVYVSFC